MKRKILLAAAITICLTIVASGTLAFFTAESTAHNVITTGGVSIEVVEKTEVEGVLVDFPEEGIEGVMPGTEVSKIVSVKNTGSSEAWIRVQVEATIEGDDGELPLEIEDVGPVMTFTVGSGWTLSEGYYYYNNSVAAGESTEAIFETVTFAPEMGNEYQGCVTNIVISAQAVQTANNGNSVMDAVGWPE